MSTLRVSKITLNEAGNTYIAVANTSNLTFVANNSEIVTFYSNNSVIFPTSTLIVGTTNVVAQLAGVTTAYDQANTAYIHANNAYNQANTVSSIGKQTIWIPASAMTPKGSIGIGQSTTVSTTMTYLAYDSSTDEDGTFTIAMPKGWDEGNISFQSYWAHPATANNFGVCWQLYAISYSNNESIAGTSYSGGVRSIHTGGTTNNLYISPESSEFSISGAAENDLVNFIVRRETANNSDTMAVDAYLYGIKLFYTTNAAKDN